ncbi:hypothetical protein GRAN_4929 [Granulicella sibirica]|uniref:Uncharacterized protein n=1 Tax=Granulicella sibirica TaxID=2479048 RepID=A0A4Q0SVN0_9BACT|nr:hypothetical protein GRAN_4929 [Granulicella sibirica]
MPSVTVLLGPTHLLLAPTPAAADTHAPIPQAGKKHGQH